MLGGEGEEEEEEGREINWDPRGERDFFCDDDDDDVGWTEKKVESSPNLGSFCA